MNAWLDYMSTRIIDINGVRVWENNKGQRHRVGGPAIMYPDGHQGWYINGQPHRVDGPAITRFNGSKEWYLNGKLHRVNGPAIIGYDGTEAWYFNGERYYRTDGNNRDKEYFSEHEWYILNFINEEAFSTPTLGDFIDRTTWSLPNALLFPSLVCSIYNENNVFLLLVTMIRYGERKKERLPSPDVWTVLMEHIQVCPPALPPF